MTISPFIPSTALGQLQHAAPKEFLLQLLAALHPYTETSTTSNAGHIIPETPILWLLYPMAPLSLSS